MDKQCKSSVFFFWRYTGYHNRAFERNAIVSDSIQRILDSGHQLIHVISPLLALSLKHPEWGYISVSKVGWCDVRNASDFN